MSSESPSPGPSPAQAQTPARGQAPSQAAPGRRAGSPVRDDQPVIPDQTTDDTDLGGGDWRDAERDDDERYLRERPPHW